MTTKTTA